MVRPTVIGPVALVALALSSLALAAGEPYSSERTSSPASAAAGQCSKAEATAVVTRLGWSDVSPIAPVYKVLCGSFAGPGSRVMVASLYGPDNVGMLFWAVFRWSGSGWELLLKRRQAALLTAAGGDIRESVSIYRSGDPRCCPSGGEKSRTWHWNGTRFTAGAWEQPAKSLDAFHAPNGSQCVMVDDGRRAFVECWLWPLAQKARVDAVGRLTICRGSADRCRYGDIGDRPTLAYGRQITVGRFRCSSLQVGVKCTVIRSGKGFLISRDGIKRVG